MVGSGVALSVLSEATLVKVIVVGLTTVVKIVVGLPSPAVVADARVKVTVVGSVSVVKEMADGSGVALAVDSDSVIKTEVAVLLASLVS